MNEARYEKLVESIMDYVELHNKRAASLTEKEYAKVKDAENEILKWHKCLLNETEVQSLMQTSIREIKNTLIIKLILQKIGYWKDPKTKKYLSTDEVDDNDDSFQPERDLDYPRYDRDEDDDLEL